MNDLQIISHNIQSSYNNFTNYHLYCS